MIRSILTIYQAAQGAIFSKASEFKKLGLYKQIEVIREWVASCMTREAFQTIHQDWAATSSSGSPCRGKVIFSEDRFGLCAYQVIIIIDVFCFTWHT